MTSNWVLLTLLISLCLSTSYGKQTGLSAMDDIFEKDPCQSSVGNERNPCGLYCNNVYVDNSGFNHGYNGNSPSGFNLEYNGNSPSSTDPSCGNSGYVDSGFYSDCCSCGYNPCSSMGHSDNLEGLKKSIRDLTMKLEANGLLGEKEAMNMKAMAPESP